MRQKKRQTRQYAVRKSERRYKEGSRHARRVHEYNTENFQVLEPPAFIAVEQNGTAK
jgi:hypothetical protein